MNFFTENHGKLPPKAGVPRPQIATLLVHFNIQTSRAGSRKSRIILNLFGVEMKFFPGHAVTRFLVVTAIGLAFGAAVPVAAEAQQSSGSSGQPKPDAIEAAVPAGPAVEAVRALLADKTFAPKADGADRAAAIAFYRARSDLVWTKDGALTAKADAILKELKKADDWGLEASSFDVPAPVTAGDAKSEANAELAVTLSALKYARYARGGRVDPQALSNILDMSPPVKDPKVVLAGLVASDTPDAVLRDLHPKYAGFANLRQALLKARGPQEPEAPIDEALKVKIPPGKTLKVGAESDDVVLLRKRLKLEASNGDNPRLFDRELEAALKVFQDEKGLRTSGQLNDKTRTALNREAEPKTPDPKGDVDRILVNMERWRWLPEEPGSFYVMNNIPEFVSRTYSDGNEVFRTKIVVGQPTWPTPVLAAKMDSIVFHPEWGMPDGIKVKELLPRLKRASNYGSNNFFDQLFGGGSQSGRVIEAYKLRPTLNGRPVNPDQIDWNRVDIRQFSFVQPAGAENPLGQVKFRFPNRHDVYMHDTPQKALFGQSYRALSHGCMRLEEPRRFAEVLLSHDKGWSADKVGDQFDGGTQEIGLSTPIPVYMTYFTVAADATGKVQRFADIYGHDSRLKSAIDGRPLRYDVKNDVVADNGSDDDGAYNPPPSSSTKKVRPSKYKREPQTVGELLSDVLSGF